MKTNFLVLLLLLPFLTNGQTLDEVTSVIQEITHIDQVEQIKEQYPEWYILEDLTFLTDSTLPEIVAAEVGDLVLSTFNFMYDNFVVKVLDDRDVEFCRVKYIYLDGKALSKAKIEAIRSEILQRYSQGEDFETLVQDYNMDGSPTGDLGWFKENHLVDEFDRAVRKRKKGEIFKVDVPKYRWYYVVLKTHANKFEKAKVTVRIAYYSE